MQKNFLILLITVVLFMYNATEAQRGLRIAYVDTEYILENVPEYQEAKNQLEKKVQNWKQDIQSKLNDLEQKRKDLVNEKALLTQELYEERQEDIEFEQNQILEYQQNRFGPIGDLFIQKKQLMQPIQDQIFTAVQDLAVSRKYDFIFDKASEGSIMLFSAKNYDLSDQVLRVITRTSKRKQAQSKQQKKDAKNEEILPENPEIQARKDALEQKKQTRQEAIEKRRQEILDAREAKKKEAEERREKLLADREKLKQEKLKAREKTLQDVKETKMEETEKLIPSPPDEEPKTEEKK